MLKKIPVVFATDENYAFYTCAAITSMAKSADCDTEYDVYILVNDTFPKQSILNKIPSRFPNIKLKLLRVASGMFQNVVINSKHVSRATFYRLMISELIDADQCLYLDSDVIVTEDLWPLFSTSLDGYYIAGCRDIWMDMLSEEKLEEMRRSIGIPTMEEYINAGVLLMNLREIRESGLDRVLMQHLNADYPHEDQDILNVCCLGKIKRLPAKWNVFTIFLGKIEEMRARGISEAVIQAFLAKKGIIHYATPNLRPWEHFFCWASQEWWETASEWKEESLYQDLKEKVQKRDDERPREDDIKKCQGYQRIIIFGFTHYGKEVCDGLLKHDFQGKLVFCDNDLCKQEKTYKGIETISLEAAKRIPGALFFSSSQCRSAEVKQMLLDAGIREEDILCYRRRKREYYLYLDSRYYLDELKDIFLWEYGPDMGCYVEDLQEMRQKLSDKAVWQDWYEKYYLEDWILKGE